MTKRACLEETRREQAAPTRPPSPPRGVLHGTGTVDAFAYWRMAPPPELQPFLQHFWMVQWDGRLCATPAVAETLPHPNCVLVFEQDLTEPMHDAAALRPAELSGVHTARFSRPLTGYRRVFGVKFSAGGLFPFMRRAVSSLTNRVVPAASVFGPGIDLLARDLPALETAESLASATSSYLLSRSPVRDPDSDAASDLVRLILDDPTLLTVREVARSGGISVRALQRLFNSHVGVSPKWVIRRYRLHEALERLHSGQFVDGGQLALDLGYADQAHLTNDFTRLVGIPPTEYLRRLPGNVPAAHRSSSGKGILPLLES